MKKTQELTYEQKQLKELADRLEARMHTTTVLAEIVLDNDAMRDEEAMDLLRLLASLGDALLSLRLFEEGAVEIGERLAKGNLE